MTRLTKFDVAAARRELEKAALDLDAVIDDGVSLDALYDHVAGIKKRLARIDRVLAVAQEHVEREDAPAFDLGGEGG